MNAGQEHLLPILALQEGYISVEEYLELRKTSSNPGEAADTLRLRLTADQLQRLSSLVRQLALLQRDTPGPVPGIGRTLRDFSEKRRTEEPAAAEVPASPESPDPTGLPTVQAVVDPRLSGPLPAISLNMMATGPDDAARYELLSEKGKGGMGRVWVARDRHLGREVAVKELLTKPRGIEDPRDPTERRFLREALVTGQLEHPGVVPVYELGHRDDGSLFYTMRLLRGRTLRQAIAESDGLAGRLNLIPHFRDLCLTIAYVHSRGVIHRDIKPDNIIIGEFGETVLLDWGIAKVHGLGDELSSRLLRDREKLEALANGETVEGDILGTPAYMPPEQACGRIDEIDEQSDLYSLGAVLYEILAGKPPYTGNVWKVLALVQKGRPQPLEQVDPKIPRDLAAVALKSLRPEKEGRYPDARSLAREIEQYMSGRTVGVYDYSAVELVRLFIRHHRALSVSFAIFAVLLTLAGAAVLREYRRATAATAVALTNERQARENERRARDSEFIARTKSAESARNLAMTFLEKSENLREDRLWDAAASHAGAVLDLHPGIPGSRAWDPAADHDAAASEIIRVRALSTLAAAQNHSRLRFSGSWSFPSPLRGVERAGNGRVVFVAEAGTLWSLDKRGGKPVPLRLDHDTGITFSRFFPGSTDLLLVFSGAPPEIWDLDRGRKRSAVASPADTLSSLNVAGPHALVGVEAGRTVRFVDTRDWSVTASIGLPDQTTVTWLYPMPGAGLLAAATQDNRILLWELPGGRLIADWSGHQSTVKQVLWIPERRLILSASNDRTLRLWDPLTGPAGVLEGHGSSVISAAVVPGGRWVVSGGFDRDLFVWDLETRKDVSRHRGHLEAVHDLLVTDEGRSLISCSNDRTCREWTILAPAEPQVLEGQGSGAYDTLRLGADALASAHGDGRIRIWDLGTGRIRLTLEGHPSEVFALAASPDRKRLASIDLRGLIILWDAHTGAPLRRLEGHNGWGMALAFSSDGHRLFSGGQDKLLHVWDADTGAGLRKHPVPDSVFSLVTADDRLLVGLNSGRILVWDPEGTRVVETLAAHEKCASGLSLSPDRKTLASSGMDRRIILWSARNGSWTRVRTLEFHGAWVSKVRFSPDGRHFAAASDDHSVTLWKTGAPSPLRVFHTRKEALTVDFVGPEPRLLVGDERRFLLHRLALPEAGWTASQWLRHAEEVSGLRREGISLVPVDPRKVPAAEALRVLDQ